MKLFRREFLHLISAAAVFAATRLAWAQEALQHVRVATGCSRHGKAPHGSEPKPVSLGSGGST